jgi:hypothetical protein
MTAEIILKMHFNFSKIFFFLILLTKSHQQTVPSHQHHQTSAHGALFNSHTRKRARIKIERAKQFGSAWGENEFFLRLVIERIIGVFCVIEHGAHTLDISKVLQVTHVAIRE